MCDHATRDADSPTTSVAAITHVSDDEIFQCYLDGVDGVLGVAELFTEPDWNRPTPCPEWSAADIAGHLLATAIDAHSGLGEEPEHLMTEAELAAHNAAQLAALPPRTPQDNLREFRQRSIEYLHSARPHLTLHSYRWGDRCWTVRDNIGVLANEWHVHAWDLAAVIGMEYVPADPAILAAAFASGMAYMTLSDGDSWHSVLMAAGRNPGDPFMRG